MCPSLTWRLAAAAHAWFDNRMICIAQAGKVGLVNLPVSIHSQLRYPA